MHIHISIRLKKVVSCFLPCYLHLANVVAKRVCYADLHLEDWENKEKSLIFLGRIDLFIEV